MLNVQLDRLPGMIEAMRSERQRILEGTKNLGNLGPKPAPMNSPDHDCATHALYTIPSEDIARKFIEVMPSVIAGKTGRHNYTEWGRTVEAAARAAGVSKRTAYKWLARHRAGGEPALRDRSSAPTRVGSARGSHGQAPRGPSRYARKFGLL